MNRRIALGTFVLLAVASVGYAADPWDGVAGMYKTKNSKTAATVRKAEGREAGPYRWLDGAGANWAVGEGSEGKPGGGTVYYLVFNDGPFKGDRFDIIRGNDGKVTTLQQVNGAKKTWLRQ